MERFWTGIYYTDKTGKLRSAIATVHIHYFEYIHAESGFCFIPADDAADPDFISFPSEIYCERHYAWIGEGVVNAECEQ